MKRIVIKIDKKTGDIIAEAFGYDGVSCHFDLDEIGNILASRTIYSENKEDNEYVFTQKEVGSGYNNK